MVMQSIFPPGRAPLINYDWIDIDSATGYILYDGWGAKESTGDTYHITPSDDAGQLMGTIFDGSIGVVLSAISTANTYTELLDLDFDSTPLQLPKTIKGQMIVKVPFYKEEITDAGTQSSYIIVKLRKWNAGTTTETEIASVQSIPRTDDTDMELGITLPITVPQTHFKKGEQIRLTIGGWAKSSTADNHRIHVACNPNDSIVAPGFVAGNTRLVAAIPFKIDV